MLQRSFPFATCICSCTGHIPAKSVLDYLASDHHASDRNLACTLHGSLIFLCACLCSCWWSCHIRQVAHQTVNQTQALLQAQVGAASTTAVATAPLQAQAVDHLGRVHLSSQGKQSSSLMQLHMLGTGRARSHLPSPSATSSVSHLTRAPTQRSM